MPRYMLLMYQPADGSGQPATQEGWAEAQARWQGYLKDLTDAGLLVANEGLGGTDVATTVRVRDGAAVVTDGPFAETKEVLAGYYLIDCADLDEAIAVAARIPRAATASVEVRPVVRREPCHDAPVTTAVDRVFRERPGHVLATLVRYVGDFDLAEEAMQEAFAAAVAAGRATACRPTRRAWLITTASGTRVDRLRREPPRRPRRAAGRAGAPRRAGPPDAGRGAVIATTACG